MNLLILVENDPESRRLERLAKLAGFEGLIKKISHEDAVSQHTILPILFIGNRIYDVHGITAYFHTEIMKKDKNMTPEKITSAIARRI